MDRRRRIGAYGLCRDGDRVLLARGSGTSAFPGVWQLPGGGIEHGEHPVAAVLREFAEETGLSVEVTGLRAVLADVVRLAGTEGPVAEHTDRIVYDVARPGGVPATDPDGRPPHVDPDGGSDAVAWFGPGELAGLALMPFTAELLGRPVDPLPEGIRVLRTGAPARSASVDRRQRFAAYGLATDPAGRILLARIADGFPGAGRWHLPGGGTDHGEQPASALLRELVEETGQLGRITALLRVSHRHNTSEFGPEGRALDWHGVRVIYRVLVDAPTEAKVTEAAGGSTASAGWFRPAEAAVLPHTEVVGTALSLLGP
ncbi:NUDIX hydrolase [Plantactinospora soyae]|uniref:ADP-ribose pyrophosphatase YjhB (NUDIX family) n=1 Tax=Plantactinospora soyae TaxID=1544732 RepID=A0A927M1E5_9ACTN|nr:NUDIX domain-containing protein [Plantactinospora soyae]MBE1485037.1 ADP-ribose pyrophosphatase YjhB (NUDIX family) [Plantactinospora soyae]